MQAMEHEQSRQEEKPEIMSQSIQEFIDAARQYLFDAATSQPVLATIPVHYEK